MEKKAPDANQKVSNEGDDKYGIMAMPYAAGNSLIGKKHKHQIGQGIDNLSGIWRSIIILTSISIRKA